MQQPIVIGHAQIGDDGKRIKRVVGKPGTSSRNIIVDVLRGGYRHQYHATKGWRRVKE